jgi:hypothetical protein
MFLNTTKQCYTSAIKKATYKVVKTKIFLRNIKMTQFYKLVFILETAMGLHVNKAKQKKRNLRISSFNKSL